MEYEIHLDVCNLEDQIAGIGILYDFKVEYVVLTIELEIEDDPPSSSGRGNYTEWRDLIKVHYIDEKYNEIDIEVSEENFDMYKEKLDKAINDYKINYEALAINY